MLDFSKGLGSLIHKSAAAPAMALVVFSKSVGADAATAILKEAGFEHADMVKKGDSLLFPAEDFDLDAHLEDEDANPLTFYKIDDLVGFGVTGDAAAKVQKGFQGYDYTSKSFKDVMATNTAMPMVRIAMSALGDTFYNIMDDADSPDKAAEEMTKAAGDFSQQVSAIVKSIPAAAFKLDAAVRKAAASEEEAGADEDDTEEEGDEEDTDVQKGAGKGKGKKGDEEPKKTPAKKSDDSDEEDEEEEEDEEDEGGEADPVSKSDSKLDAILKGLATLQKGQEKTDKAVSALRKDVDETKSGLKKMDEDLGSGVLGVQSPGDNIQKGAGEEDGDEGYINLDTAYSGDPFADDDVKA